MKKLFGVFTICFVSLIILIIYKESMFTTYTVPPKISQALFGCQPEEFQTNEHVIFSRDDFRKNSHVDKFGNLVIKLTDEQESIILDYYDCDLEEFGNVEGVSISDDYKDLKMIGDKDSISDIYWNHMRLLIFHDMAFLQLFNGENPETIAVTLTIIEEATGKVVYSATWPNESVLLSVGEYDFTS